jgi:uncharacterized protein YjiS (DUF1127 family)
MNAWLAGQLGNNRDSEKAYVALQQGRATKCMAARRPPRPPFPGLDEMNARVSKEELALLLPNAMSHYFRDEDDYAYAPPVEGPGLLARIGAAVRWLVEIPKRQAVMDELSMMSDHELADIGLTRAELPRVFDPAFAAARDGRTPARGRFWAG